MRALRRLSLVFAFLASSILSQSVLAAACPTSAEMPAKINSARYVLTKVLEVDRSASLVSEDALIKGLVDFIVARGKAEVRVWFLRSVVDTLCTQNNLKDYFSSTCLVYNSPLFNQNGGGLSEADFSALVRDIKTDATYAPACALHTRLTDALANATIPGAPANEVAEYKEGIASLGYYYTAVATEATDPVEGADSFLTIAKGVGDRLTVAINNKPVMGLKNDLVVLAAWQSVAAASKGDYAVALTQISPLLSTGNVKVPERVAAALRTAVAIAAAKDEESVAAVLDSVASPVGAWAVKQAESDDGSSKWVTSITALPGIQIGRDKIGDAGGGVKTNSYGLFLPIGVQFSKSAWGGAVSLMLSPVDAGGVVSYAEEKTSDGGTVQSTAPVTWQSIIAPGAYATYSFHDSPFVIGVGYQRAPRLRSVKFSDDTEEVAPTNRVLLFFAVDVTLFMHAR